MKINPGIVKTVAWLRTNGFDTCDSGDGKTHDFACDLDIAYVHSQVKPELLVQEALRLRALVESVGIKLTGLGEDGAGVSIEASFSPVDGLAHISLFGVTDEALPSTRGWCRECCAAPNATRTFVFSKGICIIHCSNCGTEYTEVVDWRSHAH